MSARSSSIRFTKKVFQELPKILLTLINDDKILFTKCVNDSIVEISK